MRIKRIVFLDPASAKKVVDETCKSSQALDQIGINQRSHEPIGLCYVAAWSEKRGFQADIVPSSTDAISVQTVLRSDPNMACFSALTYNYGITKEVALRIKHQRPGIITVLGGYQATCAPEEVSRELVDGCPGTPLFDFVVSREADYAAADLAEFVNGDRKQNQIRGLVYRNGCIFTNNFIRINPDSNPLPHRTEELMQNCRRYGLYYPAPSQQRAIALMVGSRGCPFHCKFCLSKEMFPASGGQSTLYRNPENVIQEIETLQSRFGTNAVFFVDLDFYGLNKPRIASLCSRLAKTKMNWFAMSRVTAGSGDGTTFDPEIFELMKAGGCTQIGFGVESLIHKQKSGVRLAATAWQELVRSLTDHLHKLGILSKGYFILGDYGDTLDTLAAEEEAIMNSGFDDIRLSWMMYSPGTPWYNFVKKENGFVSDELSLFSTDYPIIRIPGAVPDNLQKIRQDIQRRYYCRPQYGRQAVEIMRRGPHLTQSFQEWNDVLVRALGQGFLKP